MSENSTHKIYQFDCFRLEAESRRLWCDDKPLRLPSKTFDVLLYLVERHGAVVEREELLREIWRDQFVEDGNLTVRITEIRKMLGDTLGEARFIATVSRRGYCFVARVREIEENEQSASFDKTGTSREKSNLKNRPAVNDEAYRTFLKGLHLNGKRTKEAIEKGLEYFRRAVELDSTFALAYVWIAQSYRLLNDFSILSHAEAMPLIKQNLERAVALEPDLAEARTLSGYIKFVHEWNWQEAENEFRRAVELNPNSILARYSYANFLKHIRRFDEASQQLNQALELDPLSPVLNQMLGAFLFYEKRYTEADAHFREQAELYPNSFVNYVFLSACSMMRDDFAASLCEIQKAYALEPSFEVSALLGAAKARAGNVVEARKILRKLEKAETTPFETFYLYLALGERGRALSFLERSLERKTVDHILLNIDPRADELRSDEQFTEIFSRIGLPGLKKF
ncbi:MAG TPA: winged helix-turn-helix domain-containing protein [Pyrinomonadaceae bacterium]|jgi:DNA-binding winged helix-turn-helix (wHTH) protein/Tfp pilus assembly protein PilF